MTDEAKRLTEYERWEAMMNLLEANLITSMRIYDALGAIARKANPQEWNYVEEVHNNGGLFLSEPHVTGNPWTQDEPENDGDQTA